MTMTELRTNIWVDQGRDWSATFAFDAAVDGDYGEAEIRRWATGPKIATLDVSVDAVAKTVTISQTSDASALVTRDGYYDLQVWHGGQLLPVAAGFAKLRPRITNPHPTQLTWPEFNTMTWDEWNRVTYGKY